MGNETSPPDNRPGPSHRDPPNPRRDIEGEEDEDRPPSDDIVPYVLLARCLRDTNMLTTMPNSGNSANQAHIPTYHYRDVTVIDEDESRRIQRYDSREFKNLNEGPFPIKTETTADICVRRNAMRLQSSGNRLVKRNGDSAPAVCPQNDDKGYDRTSSYAGARPTVENVTGNKYCPECEHRSEMYDSIVIRAGNGTQQFMSRDHYTENGRNLGPPSKFLNDYSNEYHPQYDCQDGNYNFSVVQVEFNVREYAQGAENLFDVYNNVKTETSAQRQ